MSELGNPVVPSLDDPSSSVEIKQTASGAVNAGGVAPGRRIVHMKVPRPWLGKETPDCMLQLSAVNQLPADHHGIGVERAYGQPANAHCSGT